MREDVRSSKFVQFGSGGFSSLSMTSSVPAGSGDRLISALAAAAAAGFFREKQFHRVLNPQENRKK